ncbi:DNA-binding GntR family transcriptional regulator [Bradyrhizobium japonicum]|jgi:DNA-binding GntR family transcriptional regulator|uniref:DNA-binding GntR family transcriptional regulator n=2 Tax=Bradyrhizobium TaxID=374 RepID=A0A1E3EY74_BRAEL|nr:MULTISPECIES: GntR family transcriptional regulator [Bradyrhizobium]MBP1295540.1 DNA-binding GntR family transcriptional regulator [Bradyrhizobium elkanii]MBP2433724.1 DNA-binding GntR family transcriptional regulator [Bradyrhizobium elkanii]MCP1732889.1 DNA-binding GntR family transcriptional regulator [Bradyrhizobium elkanii]MCP1933561.1 DNA-binding GntR family transcriptional regulator [Bradyrhizobium elkanii]MCP1968000.1 DNA-binding GntR family transcriptional regulator [Bradyrhizobium 
MDQNLREQVLQRVRAEIISGQSLPGTMYSVPSLAASLGVSSTPVREALLELSRGGLVEPMRNRGFKVVEPTLTELRNLFDMREVLELHAAVLVAANPPKDLAVVRGWADQIAKAVETDDVQLYLEADRNYHREFIAAAGNDLLTDTVMGLRDKMRLYGISSRAGHERQQASVPEHYRLIELALAGETEALTALLRTHIRSWEPIFVDALLRSKEHAREPLRQARG